MKNSSTLIAFISAFALHIIIGGLLLISIDFSLPREKPKAAIIEASAVSQKLFDDLVQRKKEKAEAERRKKEQLRREKERIQREKLAREKAAKEKAEREAREKAEKIVREKAAKEKAQRLAREKAAKEKAQRLAREKAAREKAQRLAREKAAKEKAQRLAREKAAKEKAQRLAREKAAKEKAQRLAREKAAKEKAERLAREKAAQEKERLRQAELDRQMQAEFAEEFSSARSAKQLSEIARYKALIQDKISRNWQVNPDMKGKSCTLAIRLASDGLVLSVKRSRGDQKLCSSAERAALKAKTLPIPKDPEIAAQFRDFDITLEPDL
jgi:colicin import membrane protein